MKKALNKKGITLVELIIVIAVIAILGVVVANIIVAPIRASARNQQVNLASQAAHALGDFIREELTFASGVYVGAVGIDTEIIDNNHNLLNQLQAESNFNIDFGAFRISGEDYVLRIVIRVIASDGANVLYTNDFTVRCVNLELLGVPIVGGTEYPNVNHIVSYN